MAYAFSNVARIDYARNLVALTLLWLMPLSVESQELPTVKVCNDCSSDLQYGQAALLASTLPSDQSEDIYVVNIWDDETRVYRVTLAVDDSVLGDTKFDVHVAETYGDERVLDDIAVALEIVHSLREVMMTKVTPGDLDLLPGIDSAIDLVGPKDSGAGGYRRQVQNSLTQFYERSWQAQEIFGQVEISFASHLNLLVSRFMSESRFFDNRVLRLQFDDNTEVLIDFESIGRDLSALNNFIFVFEINENSITAPGLIAIPQSPGEFSGFAISGLDNQLSKQLRELMDRLGVGLDGPADVEACTTSFTCERVGGKRVDGELVWRTPQCTAEVIC